MPQRSPAAEHACAHAIAPSVPAPADPRERDRAVLALTWSSPGRQLSSTTMQVTHLILCTMLIIGCNDAKETSPSSTTSGTTPTTTSSPGTEGTGTTNTAQPTSAASTETGGSNTGTSMAIDATSTTTLTTSTSTGSNTDASSEGDSSGASTSTSTSTSTVSSDSGAVQTCEGSKKSRGNTCTFTYECEDGSYVAEYNEPMAHCFFNGMPTGGCEALAVCQLDVWDAVGAVNFCCDWSIPHP